MRAELSAESFSKLLLRLDPNQEQAGEKYEELRRKLIRFFEWRGALFPEELGDETLDRLARRIDEGVTIETVESYCLEIARLVFLESLKGSDRKRASLEDLDFATVSETSEDAEEKEVRFACLDACLDALPEDSRKLIIEYYRDRKRDRINHRKALAKDLGLNREALANRAQRLRDKLEQCVSRCVEKKLSI
jgi:DNA-directed RNA polymerase specialized sigma24 family protein